MKPPDTLESYRWQKHSYQSPGVIPRDYEKDPWFIHSDKRIKDKNWWPCLRCNGKGSIRIPNDWVTAHICPKCEGSGKGTKEEIDKAWKREWELYNKAQEEHNKLLRKCEAVMDSLSKEDYETIMIYFEPEGCCDTSLGWRNEHERHKKKK